MIRVAIKTFVGDRCQISLQILSEFNSFMTEAGLVSI